MNRRSKMVSTFQKKIRRGIAVPGILTGLTYFSWLLLIFFQVGEASKLVVINMTIGITWLISVALWLTGLYLWHKDEIKVIGIIGYIAAMIGHGIIAFFLFTAHFDLSVSSLYFSLRVGVGMILFNWGIMLLGSTLFKTGRFPSLAIILWIVGLVLPNAGLAIKWPGFLLLASVGSIWCGIYLWRNQKKQQKPLFNITTAPGGAQRLISLDMLRGLIMVAMAIDHASLFIRKTHPFEMWNVPVTNYFGNSGMFLTRFVTHFCATGFFFLMGIGMILFAESRKKNGWSHRKIMGHLAARGVMIIVLEKILWTPIIYGSVQFTKFGVLYALGGSMLACVLLLRFNRIALFLIGLAGIIATQVLPQLMMNSGFYNSPFAILLLVPQAGGNWVNIYPLFPWMSISIIGMLFGKEVLKNQEKAYKKLLVIGLICLTLFPVVRGIGSFGNFRPPVDSGWIAFFNVVKYPPSLVFTLITLGVNCVFLFLFEKYHNRLGKYLKTPFLIFGKTALYFYFAHWFLYPAIGSLFYFIKANLLWMYACWAIGLLMLYTVCNQYLKFKQRTAPNSIWRFI